MDKIWNFLTNGFASAISAADNLIDNITTTDEERLAAKAGLQKIMNELKSKGLDVQQELIKQQGEIIKAEASGKRWLQNNWRPITMLSFVGLIIARWLGLTVPGISPDVEIQLFELIKIGLGGYVIGRSVEKVVPQVVGALKNKDK